MEAKEKAYQIAAKYCKNYRLPIPTTSKSECYASAIEMYNYVTSVIVENINKPNFRGIIIDEFKIEKK